MARAAHDRLPDRPPALRTTFEQEQYHQGERPFSTASNIIAMYAGDETGDTFDHMSSRDSYGYFNGDEYAETLTPSASDYAARNHIIGNGSRPLPPPPTTPAYRSKNSRSPLPPTPASSSSVSASASTSPQAQLYREASPSGPAQVYAREYASNIGPPSSDRYYYEDAPSASARGGDRSLSQLQHTPSVASSSASAASNERAGLNSRYYGAVEASTPPPWSPQSSLRSFSSPSEPSTSHHHPQARHHPNYSYSISSASSHGGEGTGTFGGREERRKVSGPRVGQERMGEMPAAAEQMYERRRDPPPPPVPAMYAQRTPSRGEEHRNGSSRHHAKTPPSASRLPPLPSSFDDRQPFQSSYLYEKEKGSESSLNVSASHSRSNTPRQVSSSSHMARQASGRDVRFAEGTKKAGGLLSPVLLSSTPSSSCRAGDPVKDFEYSQLSAIAIRLAEKVPREVQIKGSVSYPYSFTGKDVVSTIKSLVPKDVLAWGAGLADGHLDDLGERRIALLIAKSLKSQLFFHEVDWDTAELQDGVEEVYMFLEDSLAASSGQPNELNRANEFERELHLATQGSSARKERATRAGDGLEELPTGIFTALTDCYSPLCGKGDSPTAWSCYSSSCPRAQLGTSKRKPLQSLTSPSSADLAKPSGASGINHMAVAWADTVPKEFLAGLPKSEIKRQNAILELIQKEEEFLSDLVLLENLFLARLEKPDPLTGDPPPIPIGPERAEFVQEVFSNHRELVRVISSLVERLHVRQREDLPVVGNIGDIFLDAALEWGTAFETNMTNFPLAKYRIHREAIINPRFKVFLETCRRDPACHRLPMDNFLQRATTRLPRYNLHFKSILQDTDAANSDRESLARAMEIVDEQCKSIQKGVASAELKVKIREYAYNLATKRNKAAVHMDLLNPERQLVHQGRVYRKPDFTDFEWQDLLAVLFDNYLVVTKTKRQEEGDNVSSKFILAKRPIPVEMMQLIGFNDASVSRSIGLSNFHIRSNSERDFRDLYPFTIAHIGGRMEPLTLYVPSKAERDEWKAKLEEAIGLRAAVQEASRVFDMQVITGEHFAIPLSNSLDPDRPPPGVDPTNFHGPVTCAVPFQTTDGRRLIAIGCADGVWIGLRTDPRSLRKVLHIKLVTQCAVLEAFGIFVVLADKVLVAYSLEALVPSATSTSTPRPPQKLSGNRDVLFFSVGQLRDRTLLIYMKKKANESVFRALEPMASSVQSSQARAGGGSGIFSKFGKESKGSDWFRIYKTFFIPSEAYSMQFLRSKLCIVCARGFEIINLDNLLPGTIPDFSQSARDDPRIQMLAKRVETAKPLGMFKNSETEFLLCYDAFACYVDRLGEPIRLDNIIEWEGLPRSVAFRSPFILAFDQKFVEVRDSSSGQLVQLIRTQDLRNVSGSSTTVSSMEDEDEDALLLVQRERHQAINAGQKGPAYDQQQVFQLVSTAYFRQTYPPSSNRDSPAAEGIGSGRPTDLSRMATTATYRTNASSTSGGTWF